jgi:hypothetical protein
MKKLLSYFVLIIVVSFSNQLHSQWSSDVRLTNSTGSSMTSFNTGSIASSGDTIHIVWRDNRDGNTEIYYKRSTNGGLSWGPDVRLTNNSASSENPTIAVNGPNVYVVWFDNRDGNNEIYFKRSPDGGSGWVNEQNLSNNNNNSSNPAISVSGSIIHVVWQDTQISPGLEIFHKRSTDNGATWTANTRVTYGNFSASRPSISATGSFVHIAYIDARSSNDEIYYNRSTDGGITWGPDTRLTYGINNSWYPSISAVNSMVHVAWEDNRVGYYKVYYKRSTNGGSNWSSDTLLTTHENGSLYPYIIASNQVISPNVHIVWYDNRDGNYEIYYKRSTNEGISWEPDVRLTNYAGSSEGPSLSISGIKVHLVWFDNRDGDWEIYYKQNPTINLQPIPAPSNLTALATVPRRIDLHWTDNSSFEQGFKIERSTNAGSNWILRDSVAASITNYLDMGLTPHTIYYYRVYAFYGGANSSYSNNAFDTTFLAEPNLTAPPNGATGQSLTPLLNWSDVPGAFRYGLQVSKQNTFDSLVVNVPAYPTSQYLIPSNTLQNQTWYYWRARAFNGLDTGGWSAVWNFQTLYAGISTENNEIPKEFKLFNNYPNPFKPVTRIKSRFTWIGNKLRK